MPGIFSTVERIQHKFSSCTGEVGSTTKIPGMLRRESKQLHCVNESLLHEIPLSQK